jgi:dTMP kinase
MKGRFIVFEGGDGCGKTTQLGLLEGALTKRHRVLRLREPGSTPIGERVREVLLDARHAEMAPATEFLLYMAARAQLVEERIRPALKRGDVVLLDRYYYSTAAYQGAAGKLGVSYVLDFAEKTMKFPKPDLVVVLDVTAVEAARRSKREKDRVESKGAAYQARVRTSFLAMARRDRKRFRVVDASGTIDDVHRDIVKVVDRVL